MSRILVLVLALALILSLILLCSFIMVRGREGKKTDLKLHHPADAQLRAPLLAIGAYAALSPGQQGRRAKGPRAQEPRV